MSKSMFCWFGEAGLLVAVFFALASSTSVLNSLVGSGTADPGSSPVRQLQLDYSDQIVRLNYGEGFSFNRSCWIYNRPTCLLNANRNNRTFDEEPTCHPVRKACKFSRPYCKNLQCIDPEILEDTWLNGLIFSDCAAHNSYLTAGFNEGDCKYTRYGNVAKTMSWGWCTGDYCNYWPQEVANPEDQESKEAYRQYYEYDQLG